jgi:peptidyl-prolyl cis-trans isomerase SurA
MKSFNSLRRLTLLLASSLILSATQAAPLQIDRIVAVVNTAVITQHQLDRKVEQTLRQLAGRNTPLPSRTLLEKQLLERMITEKVLMQMAEDTSIRVDGASLDRAVARLAAQNNLEPAAFKAALEKEGISYDAFREQVRTDMTITRLREREVDSKVQITDAEIENYLATAGQGGEQQMELSLAHILVVAPEGASPEQLATLKIKAETARGELAQGADFAQVSAAYSDAQNALQGGTLGWRSEGKLPSLYVAAVKDLKPGEVTPVLRSASGFHIVKLLDKRGKDVSLVVQQTHARHILVKTNEVVSDQDAKNRLTNLLDRIRNGDDFEKLAKLHSDDLSAAKGGDLGWLSPGDTVPQFERAMDALQPGETSEPVRSPFGWHLIQVLERRDQDVTQERRRLEARRAIRERKAEEAFEDWVRQARDRAYVEYRLEE